ncbi:MAG: hypothetical protein NTV46_17575 [Verrucomicrobia bacterium]|nr:hypothetical protein [Verrucomicrobiota bacterium]
MRFHNDFSGYYFSEGNPTMEFPFDAALVISLHERKRKMHPLENKYSEINRLFYDYMRQEKRAIARLSAA